MNRAIFALVSLGIALATSAQDAPVVPDPVREIEPAELVLKLGEPRLYVFDCNEADMFQEAHVPGALLTIYDQVSTSILPDDKDADLVFYCYSPECPAGAIAAKTAVSLGYTHVFCMSAGITGWMDAQLRTEP